MPGVGVVMMVKDEEALLRKNLLFHRHLGVSRFYLIDDGSRDGTRASVHDLPEVRWRGPAAPAELEDRELAAQLPAAAGDVPVRQMLSASLALGLARDDGLEWLLHIDADELVAPSLDRVEGGALAALLAAQPAIVEAVRFATLELVQRRLDGERPFEEEDLFKRDPAAFSREIEDPRTGARLTIEGFYGHAIGKSAVRVRAAARPESPHVFTSRDGRGLRYALAGHLLHYHLFSAADFVRKSRRAGIGPERYAGIHEVRAHKRLFRELAADPRFPDQELRAYFARWLLFGDDELARPGALRFLGLVPRRASVVPARAVRDWFARLDMGGRPGDNAGFNE